MFNSKAIVTGHTKGLGKALAEELLTRKIPVLGLARGLSDDLPTQFPDLFTQVQLDLSNVPELQAWLAGAQLRDYLDGCEQALLVNNAGVVQPVGALHLQDPAEVAMAVSLNVAAPLMLSAAVATAMLGKQVRILHVSSGAARSAYPGWSVYCATKAALDHHARAVALDGVDGVRVCSLAPGVIDTDMQAAIRATPADRFPMRERFMDLKRDGALVSPADCAREVISNLLSSRFGKDPVADVRDRN